jgi:hypothetical protein
VSSTLELSAAPPPETAPAATAPPRQRQHRYGYHILVGVILALQAIALFVLAAYGGYIGILPTTPPVLHVAATAKDLPVHSTAYCWLTPGRATCEEEAATPDASLPGLTIPPHATVRLRFDTTTPTDCTASTVAAVSADGAVSPATQIGSARDNSLSVTLAPGSYRLDIVCRWHPQPQLRWLKGQGTATYSLALTVVPR